jgi:signal transduction histidine kinase/ligand-binding sensor domain-containing protein
MRIGVTVTVLFLTATQCLALAPTVGVHQYAHTAWALRDGELTAYPRSLAQTSDGYLWLGTDVGLLRFDGMRFVRWQPTGDVGLPSPTIVKLLATRDGDLWIATARGLARRRSNGAFTVYAALDGVYVSALAEDRDGTVWAGTTAGFGESATVCAVRSSAECSGHDGLLGRFVISLFADPQRGLWIGAATGLWHWQGASRENLLNSERFPEIHSIVGDANNSLLIAFSRTVGRLTGGTLRTVDGTINRQVKPTTILHDRDGALWVGTQDTGILHANDGRSDTFSVADGLTGTFVTDVLEDREGDVWVGTLGGLDRFRSLVITPVSSRNGLSSDVITSIIADRDAIWFGTTKGLNRLRNGVVDVVLPSQSIQSLLRDRAGRLWISSERGLGILRDGAFASVSGFRGGFVQAIAEGPAGEIWVAEQEQGVFGVIHERIATRISVQALGGHRVRSLAVDTSGGVWLGFMQGGIAYWKDGSVRASYASANGLGDGEVASLQITSDGALWASTLGGLSRIKDGRVATLTRSNGLACDTVHWLAEIDSQLWIHTACGLARVTRSAVDAWAREPTRRIATVSYESSDGVLPTASLGSYGPKVATTSDGRLWFARYSGAGVIDPRHLPFNPIAPPVHIEELTADRTTYERSAPFSLQSPVRDLRIEFTAVSLVVPDKVRFRYKLEGHDADWIDAGQRRQATYADLAPRDYRFRVIAANNDGVWNEIGDEWAFSIQPAFYQTRLFTIATTCVAAVGLFSLYRMRLHRVSVQLRMRMEERLAERIRVAQELHDTLLQGFTATSMQLHVLADELEPSTPAKSKLDRILARMRSVLDEGRQAIFELREERNEKVAIEQLLAQDADQLRGVQPVDVRVVVAGEPRPLVPAIRDEAQRISREALVNALRHAQATKIHVTITHGARFLSIVVRDDGCGVQSADGEVGHWGLLGMRERAARIGATLRLSSQPGAGTEVVLMVPRAIAYRGYRRRLTATAASGAALTGKVRQAVERMRSRLAS